MCVIKILLRTIPTTHPPHRFSLPIPNLQQLLILLSIPVTVLFDKCHINRITQDVSFEVGISLEVNPSCWINSMVLFIAGQCSVVWTYHIVWPFTRWRTVRGCQRMSKQWQPVWGCLNKAAMNICVQVMYENKFFSGINAWNDNCWVTWLSRFQFWKEVVNYGAEQLYRLTSPKAMYEWQTLSTSRTPSVSSHAAEYSHPPKHYNTSICYSLFSPVLHVECTSSTLFYFNSHPRICLLILEREEGGEGERERERERERLMWERNIDQLRPGHTPTGDWMCNLGMCPDQELNPQPSGVQGDATINQARALLCSYI